MRRRDRFVESIDEKEEALLTERIRKLSENKSKYFMKIYTRHVQLLSHVNSC